ncbi:aromatic ring-opening dioxygenase LigA [Streptomyces salyersiae]|uniref:Aromatic ring-opening dioxygenase LigA n=1 Tax=Streptomyces salyersiae TaxID=3075530 RepID=A0ABU2RVB2_9ACTN|nr:aromatic ring-opening dioxygenase LigA [Streptomyces sp. DSM 41770]MDT0432773.1 aromatic ring-opening dioxygenase LigA [Streptomyces sp. DSM 41770]
MHATLDQARRLLDTPPPPSLPGQLTVDTPPPSCDHGNPPCDATPVRLYFCGYRCDAHQPAVTRPYFQPRRSQP